MTNTNTTPRHTKLTLLATTWQGYGRDADWNISFDAVSGHGPTMADAKAAAVETITRMLAHANDAPVFGRDDDGSLIVSLPRGSGWETYRVTEDHARAVSYSDKPMTAHHITPLPTS